MKDPTPTSLRPRQRSETGVDGDWQTSCILDAPTSFSEQLLHNSEAMPVFSLNINNIHSVRSHYPPGCSNNPKEIHEVHDVIRQFQAVKVSAQSRYFARRYLTILFDQSAIEPNTI